MRQWGRVVVLSVVSSATRQVMLGATLSLLQAANGIAGHPTIRMGEPLAGTPVVYTQSAELCGPTSLANGLSRLGIDANPQVVARNLYVAPHGVSLADLNTRAAELAGSSVLITVDDDAMHRAVSQRIPTIIAVRRGERAHLVLVVDASRSTTTYIDPTSGKPVKQTRAELAAERTLNALGLVFGPRDAIAAYATPAQLAEDRRNRALSLVKQASEHKTTNQQVLLLLADAVRADPCWADARRLLALAVRKLETFEPLGLPACGP